MLLGEIDPSGATRGESRPSIFVQSPQQFGAFLHDHQIGAEIGVEHDIGAEFCRVARRGLALPKRSLWIGTGALKLEQRDG